MKLKKGCKHLLRFHCWQLGNAEPHTAAELWRGSPVAPMLVTLLLRLVNRQLSLLLSWAWVLMTYQGTE